MHIALIGLGNMGLPMAKTLQAGGHRVVGFDQQPARRDQLANAAFTVADTLASAVADCEAVLLSLPTAAAVEQVLLSDQGLLALSHQKPIVIDTTTSEPKVSRRVAAELARFDLDYIDAPVSGGPAGAAGGQLSMMLGGSAQALARAQPVLDTLAAKQVHVGEVGSGHAVKLINNFLVAAHLLTVGSAFRLGLAADIEPERLITALNSGSGRSAVSEVNFPRWILNRRFDSGFSAGLMRKDLRLARQLAEELELPLPMIEQVTNLWLNDFPTVADDDDFNRVADPELPL